MRPTLRSFSPTLLALGLCIATLSGCATAPAAPVRTSEGVLVAPSGMTLYTFDRDATNSGKSVCNGPCAANWPPLMAGPADSASGDFSVVVRDDGQRQWAFKGKPLYLWSKDSKPGDRTGDGFNNLWRIARP